MPSINDLRALLSDAQHNYYRSWVRYNTAKSRPIYSDDDLEKYYRLIGAIIYHRNYIDYHSDDLQSQMRCK
jgi:hypothetical protein